MYLVITLYRKINTNVTLYTVCDNIHTKHTHTHIAFESKTCPCAWRKQHMKKETQTSVDYERKIHSRSDASQLICF